MMHEEKAHHWESKADDLEPEKQLLILQADIYLQSADGIGIKQMHMRAIADFIRAERFPRMKATHEWFSRGAAELPDSTRASDSRRSA